MTKYYDDFAVFILTNGRPDNIKTIETLERCGYTGPVYLIVDDLDKTLPRYIEKYGTKMVHVFDKRAIGEKFDRADNFGEMRTITYARNACYDIAENIGIKYFIQFDDDYTNFRWRFDSSNEYLANPKNLYSLDKCLGLMLEFYKKNQSIKTLAMSQGGDFVGGPNGTSKYVKHPMILRKCMNSFLCSTERRITFMGTMNEDVNTYVTRGSRGELFLTINHICLEQTQTQANAGGISEMYKTWGTYVKSFYTVMHHPSSVKVMAMGGVDSTKSRLHHRIKWRYTVPKIVSESLRQANKPLTL